MENTQEHLIEKEDTIASVNWVQLLLLWWRFKKVIALITGGIVFLAIAGSFIWPESYKSTAVILPETDKGKLGSLGGLSDLASLAGINTGEASLVKLYPTIVKSEAVLSDVIFSKYYSSKKKDSVSLGQFWGIKGSTENREFEETIKRLRSDLSVGLDNKTNVLTISIESEDPVISAEIVNKVVKLLDEVIRIKRKTNATEQRKWIEGRLDQVKSDLERSENALKEFREKNRRVMDSPQLLLLQERLIREVQINSTIYTELKKQNELIKIEEIKNIPIINILDPAHPAASRETPRRASVAIFSLLFGGVAALSYVTVKEVFGRYIRRLLSLFRSSTA